MGFKPRHLTSATILGTLTTVGNTFVTLTHAFLIEHIYPISGNFFASFFWTFPLSNILPAKQIFTLMGYSTLCYSRLKKQGLTFILMEYTFLFCGKRQFHFLNAV